MKGCSLGMLCEPLQALGLHSHKSMAKRSSAKKSSKRVAKKSSSRKKRK